MNEQTLIEIAEELDFDKNVPRCDNVGMHDILDAIGAYDLDAASSWEVLLLFSKYRRPQAGTDAIGATTDPVIREEGASA